MSGPVDQPDDLHRTARLLRDTFHLTRFEDERYLRWFYREGPNGRAFEEHVDQDGVRVGHVAGFPHVYHRRGHELLVVGIVDMAVASAARGRGLMTILNQRCLESARAGRDVVAFVGVPNASSTHGYTGRLRFRLVRPLPVVVCLPWDPTGWMAHSVEVSPDYLDSAAFADLVSSLDLAPGSGWSPKWSPELLRWRLAAPGARYWFHVTDSLVAVSCRTRMFAVPFAVILKLFPRIGARRATTSAIIAAACLSHRAPAAVYAGFNARARVAGIPVPRRLRPAPLNLIFRSLDETVVRQDEFRFDTFEFLEFDAY